MKLLEWKNADGTSGQCDGRCYDLVVHNENADLPPNCQCACTGQNHGVGKRAAILKTRAHATEWMAARPNVVEWTVSPSIANVQSTWKTTDPRFVPSLAFNKRYPRGENTNGESSAGV